MADNSKRRRIDLQAWALEAARTDTRADIRRQIMRRAITFEALSRRCQIEETLARELVEELQRSGYAIHISGQTVWMEPGQIPPATPNAGHRWVGSVYRFGVISDTHYGSKYAREDVAEDLYDWFKTEGIERVYHAGNYIEGEARFNRFDLIEQAHGMQSQLNYFAENYPKRKGITTYLVSGDDHEGWYAQREGVNIGQMMEDTAQRMGRSDLKDLGYIEAFTVLEHSESGKRARLMTMHPGGGSAYATSYAPQKIIEAFQPGEKPAVAIFGHYHKMEYVQIRGVHAIQAGCTKDLDPFGRKKRLSYHVGGAIIELRQLPDGTIQDCICWFRQYHDRSYVNDQFSHSHQPTRKKSR